ncbi:MAG: DUF4102 domain-containing protein [Betaproteobacteria bacterium]|nr:DUF4102 domain-containing protein [Betaproteobacteria bacterium]
MALTAAKIQNTKPGNSPLKLTDSGGLYLEVRPSGAKLWRYRYRIAGKENVFALGVFSKVGLAEARTERDKARVLVKQGIHPAHNRQAMLSDQVADNANTFAAVAREWISQNRASWSAYYLRQVERVLRDDAYPYIGNLPIRSVSAAHLLEILKRLETRKAPTMAILLRQWSSAIFRYAVSTLRADADPAAALKGAVKRPKVEHHKALGRADIPDFLKALENYGGYRTTAIAMRLLMLTFVRTGELRAAEWSEFDLDRAEWRIPAERMKMREPHFVPLSAQAVELLRELHTLTGGQRLLFPNYRRPKFCMTATTLNRALERMGYAGRFSGHGFRATASTILNEMNYRPDVIERQLAHAERNKVRASYNRAEYFPERKAMMQAWADLIDEMARLDSKVIPIKRQA